MWRFMVTAVYIVYSCCSMAGSNFCSEPYPCQSTCYRASAYRAVCGDLECYKSKLEPYLCQDTCYRKVCCRGYTGAQCDVPICFGNTTCPNGGQCVGPDSCVCTPEYLGPTCSERVSSCGYFPNISNGRFTTIRESKGNLTYVFECATGYTEFPPTGTRYELQCGKDNRWIQDIRHISCNIIDCGTPQKTVYNGTFIPINGTEFGHQALLVCDNHFETEGDQHFIQCLETGRWSHASAVCKPLFDCGKPSQIITNGTAIVRNGTKLGAIAYIQCDDRYRLFGNNTRITCMDNMKWSEPEAICEIACLDGWVLFNTSCYLFGTEKLSYTDARNFCNRFNSTLVQVDSKEENDFLKSRMITLNKEHIHPGMGYWNDLYQSTTNGNEIWRETNSLLDPNVADWFPGQPDDQNGNQSCTVFLRQRHFQWSDIECEADREDEYIPLKTPVTP